MREMGNTFSKLWDGEGGYMQIVKSDGSVICGHPRYASFGEDENGWDTIPEVIFEVEDTHELIVLREEDVTDFRRNV